MTETDRSMLTPREIVSELDKYIVGQNDAKRAVAWLFATVGAAAACLNRCTPKLRPRTF